MAWTTADIPDQSGRIAVVTGANGGLGLETSRALAAAGAHVVMAARNQEKAAAAVEDIRGTVAEPSLEVVALDLGSQESVREAAEQILAAHDRIDLLVNNAGVMGIPERKTVDGFEMQFGVDHLGHWSLTALLMPALLRAEAARIVTVTSTAHHMGRAVDPENPHLDGNYRPWRAYGQAKLANFHFGLGLQRRLAAADAPAASLIAHPGLSNTDLQAVSVQETGGGRSQRFFHRMAAVDRHVAGGGRAAAAARRDRPGCQRRRVLRAEVRQQRAAGAQADLPADRDGLGDPEAVGGLGARDRDHARRPLRRFRPAAEPLTVSGVDRAAAVRQAMRTLVARARLPRRIDERRGGRGGGRHRHRLHALRLEGRARARRLPGDEGRAGGGGDRDLDRAAGPAERFKLLWLAAYRHLAANREQALFLLQVDCSPYRDEAHEAALADGDDPLLREAASAGHRSAAPALAAGGALRAGSGARGAPRRERDRARR